MQSCWKDGNILQFGRLIRQGIRENMLSAVQLTELAHNLERPKLPLMQLLLANEDADMEDLKSFNAVNLFIVSFIIPRYLEKIAAQSNSYV